MLRSKPPLKQVCQLKTDKVVDIGRQHSEGGRSLQNSIVVERGAKFTQQSCYGCFPSPFH